MHLTLERFTSDGDSTLGILFLDGVFRCFTLEDEARTLKVKGETRIPAGTYQIRLRNKGGLTQKYAGRFPEIHKGMLWLQDVPGFEWIYIHVGNRDEDTEGCILVGMGADLRSMTIQSSRPAYVSLYSAVADAAAAGELRITVEDRDR